MSTSFKYQDEMLSLKNQFGCICPPEELLIPEFKEAVFRFVFEDINHNNNHKPPLISKPSRINSITDKKKCSHYALSCFEKEEAAKNFFNSMHGNFYKSVGDSLCKGFLDANDGKITQSDQNLHFDLFEHSNCNLSDKFVIIEKLIS
jgi:hypothetical protein